MLHAGGWMALLVMNASLRSGLPISLTCLSRTFVRAAARSPPRQ